jgi:diaminohydroxyphosphoribosylaminopyrimidine deaminase / 5-amino-6-(5-phosphoribosylamino)uracil reductase
MFSTEDARYLNRCLELASLAGSAAQPNPLVGCVIVHNGHIVGEGYHHGPGLPHAEPEALKTVLNPQCLSEAALYVNLEPCNHYGRTPPCSDAIVASGIRRVVVGMQDPHPLVSGKGIQKLRDAGIDVLIAPDPEPYRQFNKIFLYNIVHQKAWCTLKWAEDGLGRMGDKTKRVSISSTGVLPFVHQLRATHQAILIGANTAKIDQPRLNTRFYPGPNPIRIVLDPEGIVTQEDVQNMPNDALIWAVHEVRLPGQVKAPSEAFEDMNVCMEWLFREHSICSVLVEGGNRVLQKCIDQMAWNTLIRIVSHSPADIEMPVMAPDFISPSEPSEICVNAFKDTIYCWERSGFSND